MINLWKKSLLLENGNHEKKNGIKESFGQMKEKKWFFKKNQIKSESFGKKYFKKLTKKNWSK